MSNIYSEAMFPGFSKSAQEFWTDVFDILEYIGYNLEITVLIVSIIGIICNIIHLIMLSQKSMRGLTINAFLIGIGLCDLLRMICVVMIVYPVVYAFYLQGVPIDCIGPQWYITLVLSIFGGSTEKTCQQLSIWYGVTIGVLRALVIRNPLNTKISRFIDSKYGCRPLFFITIIIFPFWIIGYSQIFVNEFQLWTAPSNCTNFPPNYTQMEYFYDTIAIFGQSDIELNKIALICEGVLCKLIPCVLLPLATILLIKELRKSKAENLASQKSTDSSKRSTKLVIFMTISFLVANFPPGILYLAEFLIYDVSLGMVYIMKRLTSLFTLLNVINGTIHFLICFFMSSHYRLTAKTLFSRDLVSSSSVVESPEPKNGKARSANSARSIFTVSSIKIE